jgi:ankyrin repeat protein
MRLRSPLRIVRALVAVGILVTLLIAALFIQQRVSNPPLSILEASRQGPDQTAAAIKRGEDLQKRDEIGNTALHWAARSGKTDVMQILLRNGMSIDAANHLGHTPLHLATTAAAADVLLEAGASTAITDNNGATPLHLAAHDGRTEVSVSLLAHGADVTITDAQNRTPLDVAIAEGQIEVANLLKQDPIDDDAVQAKSSPPVAP